ncbi:hypothetical protein ABZT34_34440 [Streptomyces sp. NPDC005329]|uniref:hypothetical protein n=1 Tax=Streptomyces sp. NPDC005329 TaxID=3157034 RepID=UPI0033A23F6B
MTSHVDLVIAARLARVRAEAERKRQEREEFAARRAKGLPKRHAAKLRALADRGRSLAPPDSLSNETLAASGAQ